MREQPTGEELVRRYKANYHIPAEAQVTEQMVLKHWDLERALTAELKGSNEEDRWEVFERCYSTLYAELPWLNELTDGEDASVDPGQLFGEWVELIGPPPQDVFEVGSGKGNLISFLAAAGYRCKGTEITRQRGESLVRVRGVAWGTTDGVHLDRFEEPASFDVVVSDQVIEHLHPDDLVTHLTGARAILRPGGRYIFSTPHRHLGPMDVSRVFGLDRPEGMHLKEYTHSEMKGALLTSGFTKAEAVLRVPRRARAKLGGGPLSRGSRMHLGYLILLERMIGLAPSQPARRRLALAARWLLFDGIWMIGTT